MVRIAISVEGPTEREFVQLVLAPYLSDKGINLTPIVVCTKRECSGKKHVGGDIRIQKVKEEVQKLLPCFDYVTTFYDFYGFNQNIADNVNDLEKILFDMMNNHNFIPYVQKYEFESLVFCNPTFISEELCNPAVKIKVKQIINSCGGIENINNSRETAPSKRLIKLFDEYDSTYAKVYHGPLILEETGIDRIRGLCPRFNEWIERIISLTE